jgi:outer membrane protein assembly factor BamB
MMRARIFFMAIALAMASLLVSCDTITDLIPSGKSKSKLRGERVSVITSEGQVAADPQMADIAVQLPPPYRNTEWPEPGGYADNVMHHLEAAGPLQQIWSASAGKGSDEDSRLSAPPIVAEGRIYALDAESNVTAFDANTGEKVWQVKLAPDADEPEKGFGGGLAYDDGKLFAASGFGFVKALDAKTGKDLWKRDLSVPINDAPVANGGRVFAITQENHLYALAAVDGHVLWDQSGIEESAGILSGTSPAVAGEFVVAPYSSGELFAMRVENGRVAWNDMLSRTGNVTALTALNDIAGRPVIDRGMVFAISHSGRMVAIDIRSGERVWTNNVSGTQTPWVAGDFVFVVSIDGQLICLSRKDGRIKWITQLQHNEDPDGKSSNPVYWAGPVLASDRLLLLSSNGHAVSVSPYTGQVLGQVDIRAGAFIAPVVANGVVYMLTNDAELIALK